MRLVFVVTVQLLLLIVFSGILKAQVEAVNTTSQSSNSTDTLTADDWSVFDKYFSNNQTDSAYGYIAKKLLSGKHKLTAFELINKLPSITQVFVSVGRVYQLQPVFTSLTNTNDSLYNLSKITLLYASRAKYYQAVNDWKNAFLSNQKLDSLNQMMWRNEKDSLLSSSKQQLDSASSDIKILNQKLKVAEKQAATSSGYVFLLAGATIFLLLIVAILFVLLIRRKVNKQTVMPVQEVIEKKQDLHPLAQHVQTADMITTLMLQKGRTGEDLTYLKVLEHSIEQTLKNYFALDESPSIETDQIIKRLKHIRLLLIGTQASELMLLKDMLKRSIRLTEVITSELLNADTLSQQVDAYIILEPHPSLTDRHQLPEIVKSKLISIGFSPDCTLTKPFQFVQLIQELMKLYAFKEQETTSQQTNFNQTESNNIHATTAIDALQDTGLRSNRTEFFALLNSLKELQPNNEALHHQIEKLIQHYDALNSLQIELAVRNIISYLNRN